MAKDLNFSATLRTTKGKVSAKYMRAEGKLPAVVYGHGEAAFSVEVNTHELQLLFMRTIGKNALLTMNLVDAAGKTSDTTVMFKEVQRDPVRDHFVHIDFYHVNPKRAIKLKVPVVLEGVPKGVKELGGILDHPTRFLYVRCLPADIPADIRIQVAELGLEDSVLLQNVAPPKGVTFLDSGFTVLAHVAVLAEEKVVEVVPVEGVEGAVPEAGKDKKPGEADAAAKPGDAKGAVKAPDAKAAAKPAAKK